MAVRPSSLHQKFARVLASWIVSSDLSQKRIAEAMGRSESVLTAMRGERLTFANLERLLHVLGKDLADLGLAVRGRVPGAETGTAHDRGPSVSRHDAAEIMLLVSGLRRRVRRLIRERNRLAGRVVELEMDRLPEREAAMRRSVMERSVEDDEVCEGGKC